MRRTGWQTDVTEQREPPVLGDEFLARRGRRRSLIAIVLRDQFDLAAMHAAALVHVIEIRLDAIAHLDAELRGGSAEDRRLAEQNPVRATALLRAAARRQNRSCPRHR